MQKLWLPLSILLIGLGFFLGRQHLPYTSFLDNSIQLEEDTLLANAGSKKSEDQIIYTTQEEAVISLFENAAPSVVFINTSSLRADNWTMNIMEYPQGSGTGFIWDNEGHIVTNYHVIEGGNRFTVTMANQETYDAILVGYEASKDLAVLKIKDFPDELKISRIGKSTNLRVGQSVYAIGNPFGLDQSLTTGIISALGREIKAQNGLPIKDVIQTDAAINPGNSGGPLLDSGGRVIGVNTAIYSPSGASAGIGFSIPIDVVKWVIPDLIQYGELRKPQLGIHLVDSRYVDEEGVMILSTSEGSPADLAGLVGVTRDNRGGFIKGDIIKKMGDYVIKDNEDLIITLEKFKVGDEIELVIKREGQLYSKVLQLASSVGR